MEPYDPSDTVKGKLAEDISLGLFGAARLDETLLAESITWQNGGDVCVGRRSVVGAVGEHTKSAITIDEVVTHGKAAAVSGKLRDQDGTARLFCHMIRFTSASAAQVASIVSFEHQVRAK